MLVIPISILISPFLYAKLVANSIHIFNLQKKRTCSDFTTLLNSILFGYFFILGSFAADLIKLSDSILKDEKHFEFKYKHQNIMEELKIDLLMKSFFKTFIIDYEEKYKGMGKTEYQQSLAHISQFRIKEQYHSVFCRGDLSYQDAGISIKMFNFSKILASLCSIPTIEGEKGKSYLNYDVIHGIFEDILIFNYAEFCLNNFLLGVNFDSIQKEIIDYGYHHHNYTKEKHQFCSRMTRDSSDLFNFFSINLVTRSFTNI